MTDPTRDALDLRFRPAAPPLDPPDVAAFGRAAAADTTGAIPRPTAIGVAPGSAPWGEAAPSRLVVFFEHATYEIPAIGSHAGLPDLDAWSLRPTRFGWLAAVPQSRGRVSSTRAAWIVAACLPLALSPAAAQASAPAKPTVQAPAKPEPEPAKTTTIAPELPPLPGERTRDLVPPDGPPPPAPSADAVCPEPVVAIPEWMLEDRRAVSVVDAAWEGVIGYDVELELKGGRDIDGRVTAVQPDTFTLIHRETGVVRVLQKSSVVRLRVAMPKPLPTQDGMGMLVGGGLLTAIGAPVFLSGAVFLGVCPSCAGLHIPLLLTGAGALGGGIPMLVGGTRRRRAYNEAREKNRWTFAPSGSVGRQAWTGGLRLRF